MKKIQKSLVGTLSLLLSATSFAGTAGDNTHNLDSLKPENIMKDTSWLLHIGGFFSHQGTDQHINLNGLVGNEYTPTKKDCGNVIVGAGFLRPATSYKTVDFEYGIQLYYLPGTVTGGGIKIENVLPNLEYKYTTSFLPLYANLKANIATKYDKTKLTLDFGIGPDFMRFSNYREQPLTAATIPNNFFPNQSTTTLATLFGVGFRSDQLPGDGSLEVAYRFFYLGSPEFSPNNSQVLNNFKTGAIYANAITLTMRT